MTSQAQATRSRINDIAETMVAAENTRCACGCHGSWEHTVRGTTGVANTPVTWAGCPNCTGSAIGAPLSTADFRHAMRNLDALYSAKIRIETRVVAENHAHQHDILCGGQYTLGAGRIQPWDKATRFPVLAGDADVGGITVDVDGNSRHVYKV